MTNYVKTKTINYQRFKDFISKQSQSGLCSLLKFKYNFWLILLHYKDQTKVTINSSVRSEMFVYTNILRKENACVCMCVHVLKCIKGYCGNHITYLNRINLDYS